MALTNFDVEYTTSWCPSSLIALVIGIWLAPSSLQQSSVLRRGVRRHEHDVRADGKEFAIQFFERPGV